MVSWLQGGLKIGMLKLGVEQRELLESLNIMWKWSDEVEQKEFFDTEHLLPDKYSCNPHCTEKIPRGRESESVMRDISAYLQWMLFTNTACYSKDWDCQPNVHLFCYPSAAADSWVEVNLWIFRFRWGFYNKAKEERESGKQIWLWVLLQLSSVILEHSLALK